MKPGCVRKVRLAFVALIAAGMVAYVRRVPWAPALATMSHASLELLVLALGFHWLALTGKAAIWWTFLLPLGGPRLSTVARGTLMGATLNSLLVGSSGEAGRVLLMSRLTGIPSASVMATVVLERAVDLCGFLTLLACAAVLFPIPRIARIGMCVLLSAGAAVALVHRLRGHRVIRRPTGTSSSSSLTGCFQNYVRHVLVSTRDIATTRRVSIGIAFTLVDWCSELASYSLIARAAHFQLGVSGSLLALLAVNVGFLVRVTPGNVGVFELVYATVAHSLGFPYDIAIGVALMLHLVQDVPTSLLGVALGVRFFAREALAGERDARARTLPHPVTTLPSSAIPLSESVRGTST